MCGILGSFSGTGVVSSQAFDLAASALAHRGPDNKTIKSYKNGFLGHLRLAIIDLSSAADQPFEVEDRYHMVFNGEIYNYVEVKERLKKEYQIDFKTNSDTEVLLHAFIHEGERCLDSVNGMFAFAIYDSVKNVVFAARDRVGKKPFYYSFQNGSFSFASELKGVIPTLGKKPALSKYAINEFLSIGYIIAPRTIYEDVFKLEPGHFLYVDLSAGTITKKEYWDALKRKKEFSEAGVTALVKDAVDRRYVSDVPVGIMLSGGLDSNIVLALSKERKPKTFTIKSDHQEYDESELAAYSAREMGCENLSQVNKPNADIINQLVHYYDEPMADSSAIPTFLLSKFIRSEGYKCVLNGDGADEVFAGYDRYKFLLIYKNFRFLRHFIPDISLGQFRYKGFFYNLRLLKSLLAEEDIEHAYAERNLINKGFEGPALKGLNYKDEMVKRLRSIEMPGLNKFIAFDYKYYLPDDLLVKMDRATMANSVESRSPFLDYRLAEILLHVDFEKKISIRENKMILRKLFGHLLPERVIKGKKKGFQVPIDHWFLNELNKEVLDLKNSDIIRQGYVSKEYVDHVVDSHLGKKANYKFQIFILLTFEKWYKKWAKA